MAAEKPYEELGKTFHEPNRLAIMSELCAAADGLAFVELKDACGLTDGNLNRHLKVLAEAGIIKIKKEFVESKPRTTVAVTAKGLGRFNDYLGALSTVLDKAKKAVPAGKRTSAPLGAKSVRA